jgi:hypothetical protein
MRVQDQKSGKLRLNLHGTSLGGEINWLGPKKNSPKRRALDLVNLKNQARDQGRVPTQGLNLLYISPNGFLGNWTLDPRLNWPLG